MDDILAVMQFATEFIAAVVKMLAVGSLKDEGMIIILPVIMRILTFLILTPSAKITTKFGIVYNSIEFPIRTPTPI